MQHVGNLEKKRWKDEKHFQKILVANTAYIKDDSPCSAKIYQLDRDEDADYIKKLNKS